MLMASNYVAITKIAHLSPHQLRHNSGFWFLVYYFSSFSVLSFLSAVLDWTLFKNQRLRLLSE